MRTFVLFLASVSILFGQEPKAKTVWVVEYQTKDKCSYCSTCLSTGSSSDCTFPTTLTSHFVKFSTSSEAIKFMNKREKEIYNSTPWGSILTIPSEAIPSYLPNEAEGVKLYVATEVLIEKTTKRIEVPQPNKVEESVSYQMKGEK